MADLADQDSFQLISELSHRGYEINNKHELDTVYWQYNRGCVEEALLQLERIFPELKGISTKRKN